MKEMMKRNEKIFYWFTDINSENILSKNVKEYGEFLSREQKWGTIMRKKYLKWTQKLFL